MVMIARNRQYLQVYEHVGCKRNVLIEHECMISSSMLESTFVSSYGLNASKKQRNC